MAKAYRFREMALEHDEPLTTVIVRKLNEHGTIDGAAHDLGISTRRLFAWVKEHGVIKRVVFELPEAEHA